MSCSEAQAELERLEVVISVTPTSFSMRWRADRQKVMRTMGRRAASCCEGERASGR